MKQKGGAQSSGNSVMAQQGGEHTRYESKSQFRSQLFFVRCICFSNIVQLVPGHIEVSRDSFRYEDFEFEVQNDWERELDMKLEENSRINKLKTNELRYCKGT